jgi:hypothetical protein
MRESEPENKDSEQESEGDKEDIPASKFYGLFLGYSNWRSDYADPSSKDYGHNDCSRRL